MAVDPNTGFSITVDRVRSTTDDTWMTVIQLEIPRLCTCQLVMANNGYQEVTLTTSLRDSPERKSNWSEGEKPELMKANLLCERLAGLTFSQALEALDSLRATLDTNRLKGNGNE